MTTAIDIEKIIYQEQNLVFDAFSEETAFSLGLSIRERAVREGLGLVADVRLWDRPLFYCAMPGTTGDNQHWVRRKANLVQRLQKSSYRVVLETNFADRQFPASRHMPVSEFALAGGGFPIRVTGIGVVGAITVSGLHERDDHEVAVAAACAVLGRDLAEFALSVDRAA